MATTPYDSISAFFPSAKPSYLPSEDVDRILSYGAYEDLYWANLEAFKLVQRGSNANPIYIPAGRVIVDTINRYLAKDMEFRPVPEAGTDQEKTEALAALKDLFDRERFWSKFSAAKRYGIIQGDWVFHITADDTKEQGSRISINSVAVDTWFPIYDPDNVDRMIGCDIATPVTLGDKGFIKRLRYLKAENGRITSETLVVEEENWYTLDEWSKAKGAKIPEGMEIALQELPAEITAIPVYHIRNFETPHNAYGSSELRGLERLIAAISQGITDEELTLAMEGLGTYVTDAGPPVDENGVTTNWRLGPAMVTEIPEGSTFTRVNGVNTVGPFQEHLKYLHSQIDAAAATSDVAKGSVDVTIAESGIALKLRFAPIFDKCEEKNLIVKDVMRQFIYDLRFWMKAYEQVNMDNVRFEPHFAEMLPVDLDAEITRWMGLYADGIITLATLHAKLRELGVDIPEGEQDELLKEQQTMAAAGDDALGTEPDTGDDLAAEAQGATPAPGE